MKEGIHKPAVKGLTSTKQNKALGVNIADSWTTWGLGCRPLHSRKSAYNVVGPPYPQFPHICDSMDSTKHRSYCTVVLTTEKNPSISQPLKFKDALFKGQLYFPNILACDPGQVHSPSGHCLLPWKKVMQSPPPWPPPTAAMRIKSCHVCFTLIHHYWLLWLTMFPPCYLSTVTCMGGITAITPSPLWLSWGGGGEGKHLNQIQSSESTHGSARC